MAGELRRGLESLAVDGRMGRPGLPLAPAGTEALR